MPSGHLPSTSVAWPAGKPSTAPLDERAVPCLCLRESWLILAVAPLKIFKAGVDVYKRIDETEMKLPAIHTHTTPRPIALNQHSD